MAKRGPKPIQINWDEFDKLCTLQCTQVEIANWFECSVDTIENAVKREHKTKFSEYYAQKASKGTISLRRQQWQLAMKGDKTMLIWLGKQHLGQADKAESQLKVEDLTKAAQNKRLEEIEIEVRTMLLDQPPKELECLGLLSLSPSPPTSSPSESSTEASNPKLKESKKT